MKPPDMGFYGPPKKVIGFKAAPGPEETHVHATSVNFLGDADVRTSASTEYNLVNTLELQQRQICVDHTLCFTLEEEIVIAVVPDDDENDVLGGVGSGGAGQKFQTSVKSPSSSQSQKISHPHNSEESTDGEEGHGGFHWRPEQLGEQLWADLKSGLIKEKHLVANRQYIGGYEIPIQSIINSQTRNKKGESNLQQKSFSCSISGILVDESLSSCGIVEMCIQIEPGEFIVHKH